MGDNRNLCHMLGAPAEIKCPSCGSKTSTGFDDYDIDDDDTNPLPGVWELTVYCEKCGVDFKVRHATKMHWKIM